MNLPSSRHRLNGNDVRGEASELCRIAEIFLIAAFRATEKLVELVERMCV